MIEDEPEDEPEDENPTASPQTRVRETGQRERARDYQLEAIARLAVLGTPAATMSAVVGLSEPYINHLLSGKQNETFNKIHEGYKRQVLKNVVGAHFELAQMLPEALAAIRDALSAQDIRVRAENAKWVWQQIVPDFSGKKNGHDVDTFQIILNQPEVRTQIGDTMESVASSLIRLRDAVATQASNHHVKLGLEALPVPPSQLQVEPGEASVEPTQNPKTDLLLELIE